MNAKNKSKIGKKLAGITMAAIMITFIFASFAPAFGHEVPIPDGEKGIYFLDPKDSSAPEKGKNVTIDIWVNTSLTGAVPASDYMLSGKVTVEIADKACANITSCKINTTEWPANPVERILEEGKKAQMTYSVYMGTPGKSPGSYNVGTITVECNSSTYCIADLIFVPTTYIANLSTYYIPGDNGTFTCEIPEATTGDININEIMYAPTDTWGGQYNEWIELYNNDTKAINITNWEIDGKTISDATMQPGDYLIIAKNDTKFGDFYPSVTCPVIKVTIGLNDGGETIFLNDSMGNVNDSVDYTEYASGGLGWGYKDNRTLELNATGSWKKSLVDGGTPCQPNSVLAVDEIAPEIFNLQPPDGSFINDTKPTISANYSDPSGINVSSVEMRVDGGIVTPDSVTETGVSYIPATDLSEGLHNVIVNVSDNAVSPNTNSTSWSFTVDITEPTIEFVEPPTPVNNTEVTVNYVNVTVNVTDNFDLTQAVGILWWNETEIEPMTKIMYALNNKSQFNFTKTNLANGDYTYKVYANDTAGNMNVSETRVVTVNVTGLPKTGDMDGSGGDPNLQDVILLARHVLISPDQYPIYADGDVDSSGGDPNLLDVILLARHVLISPDQYPIYP